MFGLKEFIFKRLKAILMGINTIYHPIKLTIREEKIKKINFKSVGRNLSLGDNYIIKNAQYISIGNNFSTLDRFRSMG